jgi:hypothetical protein
MPTLQDGTSGLTASEKASLLTGSQPWLNSLDKVLLIEHASAPLREAMHVNHRRGCYSHYFNRLTGSAPV